MPELTGAEWNLSAQKRTMDVVGLTAMMPVLGPIGAAALGAVELIDRMDPVYASTRYGLEGEPFTCYKLRTMPEDTAETPSRGSANDPRATKLGSILRKTHFDEIPQAINIYRGEMSLVGPRQLIAQDMEATMDILSPSEQADWLWARATAKPAPFGPFQLSQHKDQYRFHPEAVVYRRAISDIEYARTATFRGDLKILYDSIKEGAASFIMQPETEEQLRGRRGAKLFASVAEHMGVHVVPAETAAWQSAFMLARTIDDMVDDHGQNDIESLLATALSGQPIGSMNATEASRLAEAYGRLTPARRQAWLVACMALPHFQEAKRAAVNPRQLATACKAESELFADMLELETVGTDHLARMTFNRWVHAFSNVAYMADTIVDLRRDSRQKGVRIEPSLQNRTRLLSEGMDDMLLSAGMTPLRTYRALAGIAVRGLFF